MKQEQKRKLIYYSRLLLEGIAVTIGIYLILIFSWELLTF
jgi:hypothetical protein